MMYYVVDEWVTHGDSLIHMHEFPIQLLILSRASLSRVHRLLKDPIEFLAHRLRDLLYLWIYHSPHLFYFII
jgi:hypothetical protein